MKPLDVFQQGGRMHVRVHGGAARLSPFTPQECAAKLAACEAAGASLDECVRALVPGEAPRAERDDGADRAALRDELARLPPSTVFVAPHEALVSWSSPIARAGAPS